MKLMNNLCRYLLYTRCPNENLQQEYWVLNTDGLLRQQFYLNFHNHGNIRKLYISDISRHSVYVIITSSSMKYMSRKIDFPYFSNLDFLHIFFNCSYTKPKIYKFSFFF